MRRYRTVIILLLLFAVPLGGAFLAVRFLMPGAPAKPEQAAVEQGPPPPKKEARKILAAARDLPVGTLLRDEDMIDIELPNEDIRRAHLVVDGGKTIDSLRGQAVREPVAEGAPLMRSAVVAPGRRGFLAAVLAPGTRAATIRLSAGTSHAGLIDPGDRVDVILTVDAPLGDNPQSAVTRTILEDVRVVAVDRQVDSGVESEGKDVERAKIVTATLEVLPSQVGRLALGEHEGTLALTVRAIAAAAMRQDPADTVDLNALLELPEPEALAEFEEDVEPGETPLAQLASPPKLVRVVRGDNVSEESFHDPSSELPGGNTPAAAAESPTVQARN